MRKVNKFISMLFISLLVYSCKVDKQVNDPGEYIRMFDEAGKGLMEEKTLGDLSFALHYKTPAYMALKENFESAASTAKLKELIHNYDGYEYYTLRIKVNQQAGKDILTYNSGGAADYEERVKYFAFDMQHDLRLIAGTDTLPCSLFHFERNYGITDYANFLISFPQVKDPKQDRTFIYEDKKLGAGMVKLSIKAEDINNLPNFN